MAVLIQYSTDSILISWGELSACALVLFGLPDTLRSDSYTEGGKTPLGPTQKHIGSIFYRNIM